jgi:hypothetical protein
LIEISLYKLCGANKVLTELYISVGTNQSRKQIKESL